MRQQYLLLCFFKLIIFVGTNFESGIVIIFLRKRLLYVDHHSNSFQKFLSSSTVAGTDFDVISSKNVKELILIV